MSFELRGREATLDPWADQELEIDRVIAVVLWLMTMLEDPQNVADGERLPHDLPIFTAPVPGVGVGISWVILEDSVVLVRLRDLTTGEEWGSL